MKKIAASTVSVMLMGSLIACSAQPAATTPEAGTPAASPGKPVAYPLKTDKTLTYWAELTGNITGVKTSHSEVPFFQEWQKKTGVPLKFTAPPSGQAKEALNVMLASGDLPDMIEFNFLNGFPGGPEKAIKDGYILKLNDLIDKHAPNLKKYLQEHPEVDKMVKTDNGSYYAFPFIRGDEYLQVFQGPIIRKDWLDELGLPVPETIDEWTTTLKAFKEKKGAAAPFSFISKPRFFNESYNGAFLGAFGVNRGFYLEGGAIKFGPAESGFKDYLNQFNQWYKDGLLDKNIATVDTKALDGGFASGATGASIGNAGGGIGKWQPLVEAKDPKAVLVAAPYPVLKKGDIAKFGQKSSPFDTGGMVVITTKASDPALAAQMLDYGYSEEGHMFFNFGTEGVSYKMENGYPKYTDLLMKNPDKLAPAQAISLYARGSYNGPFVQDKRYAEQFFALQTQRDAIEVWKKTDVKKYALPPITPTPEESSEYAKIMTDIDTLVDEMTLKIILGSEPVSQFESYVAKMKSLKLDRAIEIQKAALDRYNKR
ncbi:putative aldouronate transport system substrate-binding protein [Paenibacillus sp. UNCCL117]|uniref:extracellular solute-binding protein n=1 Tax=unclassified Paenibacillus TaxID=185978 RepID=UPI0008846AF8|nr:MULTISPECIES: extracellular solute-binding protein [unclassified Paenibacillus]SDE41082.1 putative aldouronate transport system substrate-binding protein [Paenibacillus sp. cl123]SFW65429.1 putative aldouronate transport system substrate-binding protein [Paenibacillus sp. UNCCL117]